jgi:hypothetical protein
MWNSHDWSHFTLTIRVWEIRSPVCLTQVHFARLSSIIRNNRLHYWYFNDSTLLLIILAAFLELLCFLTYAVGNTRRQCGREEARFEFLTDIRVLFPLITKKYFVSCWLSVRMYVCMYVCMHVRRVYVCYVCYMLCYVCMLYVMYVFMYVMLFMHVGRAVVQGVRRWLPTEAVLVRSRIWSSGICVDKLELGSVFSEYFGFLCQSSFHQTLHHRNHPGQATIGQSVAAVPSWPSLIPPPPSKLKKNYWCMYIRMLCYVRMYVCYVCYICYVCMYDNVLIM